ncbi:MAG: hypothetical protein KGZ45_02635 [Clostridium sp.]|jgi:ATP-dependent DNA helicase RecQ|nr:hypothetical protein [Clostridium sp.]
MKSIAYIDLEVHPKNSAILDMGGINGAGAVFHSKSIAAFANFLRGADYLCGHNIIKHDLKYMRPILENFRIATEKVIDTLYLSALLFPKKPYHALVKDEKLQTDELNNPLNDSIKVKELFADEVMAFNHLEGSMKQIFYALLQDQKEFRSFFQYLGYEARVEPVSLIKKHFASEICERADMRTLIDEYPVELAYALAVINVKDRLSVTPPWILKAFR